MDFQQAVTILDMVDSGVIMLDVNQKVVFWNQFISNTALVSLATVKQKHYLDVFPVLQQTRIEKAVDKATKLNFPSILSYKLLKTQFPLYKKSLATKPPYPLMQSIVIKPILETKKNNGCIIYINDVSAAAKREEDLNQRSVELRKTMQRYEEVKNHFQQVFKSAHNGIILFNEKGEVIDANASAIAVFPSPIDDICHCTIDQILPNIKSLFFSEAQQRYIYNANTNHEFEQELSIGKKQYLSISVSKTSDEYESGYFFAFITDITERKHIENKLLSVNAELEEFVYRTSHDLRSPIVSAAGLMNIARESIANNEFDNANDCIEHADKSLRKLETLIKDILKITESQKKEEDEQEVDVKRSIDSIFDTIANMPGIDLVNRQISLDHNQPLVTKKARFNMILENLISNAVKYQDPDKEQRYIKVETRMESGQFIMEVSDNGLGIPKDQQGKLFKMFNRFHPKVSFGSGLGLYLMKKSADVLGGDVVFIDQEQGARFKVSIPQFNHK